MRILYVDQFSEIGGGQRCFLDLLDPLEERGWEVVAALPGEGPLVEELAERGVRTERISCGPYRSGGKGVGDYVRFAFDVQRQSREIAALCARDAFDVVYVNGPRVLPGVLWGAGGEKPLLFHVHSHPQPRPVVALMREALARRRALVVACCESVGRPFRQIVPEERIRVIPNGTRALPYRIRGAQARGAVRLGVVGRIEAGKGQLLFLQCVRMLLAEFPQLEIVLCGGPGRSERYCEQVGRMAKELPVQALPWCEDIAEVIDELDVLVVPSEMEGLPRVVLEAFSAGLPVVAFPVGGISEAIEDGVTGYLARECTATGLRERIAEVLRSATPPREQVARQAYEKWMRCYALGRYQEQMLAVIEMTAFERVMQPLLR